MTHEECWIRFLNSEKKSLKADVCKKKKRGEGQKEEGNYLSSRSALSRTGSNMFKLK